MGFADRPDAPRARRWFRRATFAFIACVFVGCNVLLGYDDIRYTLLDGSAPDGPGGDAMASDDRASVDGALVEGGSFDGPDGGADAGRCAKIVYEGGFEDAATCAPWVNFAGPLSLSTTAHSGAQACRACAKVPAQAISAELELGPFAAGERIHFEAWIRAETDFLVGREAGVVALAAQEGTTTHVLVPETYQRVEVDHVIRLLGGETQMMRLQLTMYYVDAGPDAGACLVWDDVTVCASGDAG